MSVKDVTGQDITRRTYQQPDLVQAFLAKKGTGNEAGEIHKHVRAFAEGLHGNRLLDVGCGPGIHARQFARLGLAVTAIDYSEAMIRAATGLSSAGGPIYMHLDMRDIGDAFPAGSFDGAWVSASLIHVPEPDVPRVLSGIHWVLAPNGIVRITLKSGLQGARMIRDDKYGLPVDREFTFWQEQNFTPLLRDARFSIENIKIETGGTTGDMPTTWLRYGARKV